jgi:hypothetical protein
MRLLQEIAGIKWDHYKRYLLITLTYPDKQLGRSIAQQTQDRSLFLRYIEDALGREVGVLWRKEWKVRQSGVQEGQLAPHWHLLLFGAHFIPHRDVRRWWRTILGATGPLATDVRALKTGEHAARYTAKYVSKSTLRSSLDNVPYLNISFGRPWGFCRADLIPRHAELHLPDLQPDELALLRERATRMYKGVGRHGTTGFCLFHDDVFKLFELLRRGRLDGRRRTA